MKAAQAPTMAAVGQNMLSGSGSVSVLQTPESRAARAMLSITAWPSQFQRQRGRLLFGLPRRGQGNYWSFGRLHHTKQLAHYRNNRQTGCLILGQQRGSRRHRYRLMDSMPGQLSNRLELRTYHWGERKFQNPPPSQPSLTIHDRSYQLHSFRHPDSAKPTGQHKGQRHCC